MEIQPGTKPDLTISHTKKNTCTRRCGLFTVAALLAVLALAQLPKIFAAGTSPKLSAAVSGSLVQLQLQGATNQIYIVQASDNLKNWTAIATNLSSSNGSVTFTDLQAFKYQRRFYRAVAPADLTGLGGDGFAPDKILVKPLPGVSLSGLNLSLGVQVLNAFPAIGDLQVIKVPGNVTASTLIAAYQASGLVQYAEPDFYVQALNSPNDFYYQQGNLWGLNNTGQNGGTPGADIHASAAWDSITSASNVIVAVIDTGVRYTHQDLAANMWVNPADGSHGTNTVAGNSDPNDDYGHGTHVSGTIGAVGNNSVGVVGVCWNVRIMACKFLDSTGNGTISDAILCMDYARAHGAKVVNASWGAPGFTSQALHDAIASLRDADIIFVAAAGNSAANNDTEPFYPADYRDLDNVVAVAATDRNDQLASFSDYGVTNVDLAAPGTPIFSCWNGSDSDYQYDDGTSMSAAHVSGATALLRAYYPGDTHRQIINRMLAGVDPLPSLAGKTISGGRLDLAKALNATSPPPPTLTANFSVNPTSGQTPLSVQFTDTSTGNPTSWNWTFGDGTTGSTQNPSHTYTGAGNFTVTLIVGNGTQTSSKSATITATNTTTATVTADFTANPSSGQAPLAVQFTDQSSGPVTNWDWNFGDGSAHGSTQNPSHTYNGAGNFTTTLTVTGSGGQTSSASHAITVTNAPPPPALTANFSANPTSGQSPLTVQFTDTSTGNPTSWNWTFGDGTTSSTQNPSHIFNSAGNFTVTLTVGNNSGQTSVANQTITVTNAPAVTANFAANPSSGQAPLTVQFADASTGPVTSWNWNFGDGRTSTAQNPNHIYSSAGNFTAALTVTGSSGQTGSTSHVISVTNAPPPPTVTVVASQPLASILSPGVFTVTRSGSTGSALMVNYSLGGSAQNGVDYQTLSGSAVIPAGSSSTTVVVQPKGLLTLLKTVVLTIAPAPSYTVGSPNSATVMILVQAGSGLL